MVSDPDETFLTVAEVAQLLKLNQQTVRNWIDQGSLPAVRVGRRVRIKRSDFDRIVQEGYRPISGAVGERVPSAADFWSGRPVGEAEPGRVGEAEPGRVGQPNSGSSASAERNGNGVADTTGR